MKSIIDEQIRWRVLESLFSNESFFSNVLPSRLEVDGERVFAIERRSIKAGGKKQAISIFQRDITMPGMLYEILAMRCAGLINRGRNRSSGIQYWITDKGEEKLFEYRDKFRAMHVKAVLEGASTRYLLRLLNQARCRHGDFWDLSFDEIKAELAKRPHVERASERAARLTKREKGDVRRRQAARA